MRVHYLQHVPFEGLGSIEPWLESAGHQITGSRLYASPELPPPESIEALIVMGGPMSVNDEDDILGSRVKSGWCARSSA